jgi:hypothetical protein
MRQKTNYAAQPDNVKIERIGHNAVIRLRENIADMSTEENAQFEADEYTLEVPYASTLEKRIEDDYESWLNRAKQADYDKTAANARTQRNALIAGTDWTQVADVPLNETQIAVYAEYRQRLRDVPQQAGFPYDIIWPTL